jgi:hypothetical protein
LAKIIKEGRIKYYIDPEGVKVAEKRVTKEEKIRDDLVETLVAKAEAINADLVKFKAQCAQILKTHLDTTAQKHGEKWQGNATIHDFSNVMSVTVRHQKRKEFNHSVNVAVKKIDRWISEKANNTNTDIISVVRKLTKVDDRGKYDRDSLKQLLDIRIDDPLWNEAMEIIRNSLEVVSTKTYFQFKKDDGSGELKNIILDFARI